MEQNADTGAPVAPVMDNKQKDGNGLKIATIVACVVAICGIGFGVYGMMQSSDKDRQIANLQAQNKENSEVAVETETVDNESNISDINKVDSGPYIEDGYFYVPKWGVKYKLSDDLTNYGYAVDQQNVGDSYSEDRYIIGLTAEKNPAPQRQVINTNDIFGCSIVTIRTIPELISGDIKGAGTFGEMIEFGDKIFLIHDTWRMFDCDYTEQNDVSDMDEIVEKLGKILSNPEEI